MVGRTGAAGGIGVAGDSDGGAVRIDEIDRVPGSDTAHVFGKVDLDCIARIEDTSDVAIAATAGKNHGRSRGVVDRDVEVGLIGWIVVIGIAGDLVADAEGGLEASQRRVHARDGKSVVGVVVDVAEAKYPKPIRRQVYGRDGCRASPRTPAVGQNPGDKCRKAAYRVGLRRWSTARDLGVVVVVRVLPGNRYQRLGCCANVANLEAHHPIWPGDSLSNRTCDDETVTCLFESGSGRG